MSKRIWRDLSILVGLFVAIWLVFTYVPIFPKASNLSLSVEKEKTIGREMVENLLIESGELDTLSNEKINSFIDSIFYRLSPHIEDAQFDYNFIITNNNQVNAFALPGGYIIIYTGLIEFCDTPEEFSSVIAHEIGHIENRHLISRLIKKLGISILISGDSSVLEEVSQTAISTVFDRKQEEEADQFAFELLEKSGISPRVVAKLFRKLENEGLSYNKNLELLMTHPHHDDRIKASLSYKMDSTFVEKKILIDMQEIKDVIAQFK